MIKHFVFGIWLALAVGCVMEVDSEETVTETEEDRPISGTYISNSEWHPCPPYSEILLAPDGSKVEIMLPGFCNPNYIDRGDPPPDDKFDLKSNPSDLKQNPVVNPEI